MKNIVLFHLCFVFLYLLTPKVHAQVTYQSVCVENRQNSDGVNVCKLSPIYTSEWTQAGRNGVRGSVSEVIDEEIKRLTDPPSAICNLKYEVMPAEVIATDGFIHSEQPIEMKTLVLYDYSVRGPAGECNDTRYKGGFSVISRRTADCSSQQSGDLIWQSKWFSDIRSKACVRQEDFSLHSSATEGHCAASLYGFPGGAFPTYIGNPVEVSTGNKVEYELEFSDERPAPLSISRLYNSAWANGRAPHPPSSFGLGWSHSHEIWLDFDRNNVNPLTGDRSVKLKSGDHESVSINTSFGDVAVFHRFIPESTSGGAGGSYIPGAFVGDLKARVFLRIDNGWFYKNEYQDEFFF